MTANTPVMIGVIENDRIQSQLSETLFMKHPGSYYLVNAITWYRLLSAPFLFILVLINSLVVFKWLLLLSFTTDAIDGFLARRFQVVSIFGSRLDSVADDITILVSIVAMVILKPEFIISQQLWILTLAMLFFIQLIVAVVKFGKPSSFHTVLAKLAAVSQGVFILLLFFLDKPPLIIFYIAALLTAIDIAEEIILVLILKKWRTDVKGIYWLRNDKAV